MQLLKKPQKSRFGLGLVIGSVVAGAAALLLSPKSGRENRDMIGKKLEEWQEMMESGELEKRVKEIFGTVTDESVKIYAMARERVMTGIEQLKNMDGDDYAKLVQQVIDDIKKQTKIGADKVTKLKESFIKDWPKMKDEVEEGKKLAAKSRKKTNGESEK